MGHSGPRDHRCPPRLAPRRSRLSTRIAYNRLAWTAAAARRRRPRGRAGRRCRPRGRAGRAAALPLASPTAGADGCCMSALTPTSLLFGGLRFRGRRRCSPEPGPTQLPASSAPPEMGASRFVFSCKSPGHFDGFGSASRRKSPDQGAGVAHARQPSQPHSAIDSPKPLASSPARDFLLDSSRLICLTCSDCSQTIVIKARRVGV